jgi:predicted TPR repeat methyltransferase
MTLDRDSAEPAEVSIEDALKLAIAMHRDNQLDNAETLYRRILELLPAHPDALHFLGLLERQRGHSREATELMRKAVAAAPDYGSAHVNLGNLLFEVADFKGSEWHLRRALELDPKDARALNNLGNLAYVSGRTAEGMAAFEQALKIAPDFAMPYEGLGRVYLGKGDIPTAYAFLRKAVTLDPQLSQSKQFLGQALFELGRQGEAEQLYRDWIALEPDNPIPRHLLSTVCADESTPRASDEFVRRTFNNFAPTFDVHLQRLEYRAPQLVVEALQRTAFDSTQAPTVLDAGCGTGLCGELLRPLAGRLEGVDLSSGMLNQAREKGNYDELSEDELTRFMTGRPMRYHAITCADTLCYFGSLEPVVAAAAIALQPGGSFVFTVEEANSDEARDPYCIRPSGRYAHTERYLREVLAGAGLSADSISRSWLRMESGHKVDGLIAVAVRPRQIG